MQYNNFDANLLRTLDILLFEKSVTRAAERLCVSQPAVSGALNRLRDHFQDQLLIRMGRTMELTPLAESLVAPLRATLLQMQVMLDVRPSFDPKVSRRNFHLAGTDYDSFVVFPLLRRRIVEEAPFVTCYDERFSRDTFSCLDNGELDLLITLESCVTGKRSNVSQDLKMRSLYSDDFVCVVDEHHAVTGDSITMEDYERLPHVSVRFGRNQHSFFDRSWQREGLDIGVAAIVSSFPAMLFQLPGSQMIATVQRRLAEAIAPSLKLRILECPVRIDPFQQILMWHARNDSDPGHQWLRQMCVEAANMTRGQGNGPVLRDLSEGACRLECQRQVALAA